MMIIDAHAHIFRVLSGFGADGELIPLKNGKAMWADGTEIQLIPSEFPDTVFGIDRLLDVMKKNGIDKAVLLQGGFLGFDNNEVSNAVNDYPSLIAGAAAVDPFCRHADKILDFLLQQNFSAFKFEVSTGCGLMGSHRTFDITADFMYEIYEKISSKCNVLVFDIGGPEEESHQIEGIAKIAQDFKKTKIVLCHLGSPRLNQDENVKKELNLLKSDNVFFDTAAVFWKTKPETYPFECARRYLSYARETVGADHLMWGTDMPSTLVNASVQQQMNFADGIFTSDESDWYFEKTALAVYFSNSNPHLIQ